MKLIQNPQLAIGRQRLQQPNDSLRQHHDHRNCLFFRTQDDDSGILLGGVRPDIGKIQVERHKYPLFTFANIRDEFVRRPGQALFDHADGVEPLFTQNRANFRRQVLVDLELQTGTSGNAT
jgi:hypothetical protein